MRREAQRLGVAWLLLCVSAQAQAEPTTPAPELAPVLAPAPYQPPAPAPQRSHDAATPAANSGNALFGAPSDHHQVSGHFGFAYFGVLDVPIGDGGQAAFAPAKGDVLHAPTIGVRYWLNERLGIDAGFGLAFSKSSGTAHMMSAGVPTSDLPGPGRFGLLLHTGLPISVYDGGHYNALVIPELNLGVATGIIDPNPATTSDDISLNGFLLGAGVRVGAEWHLAFLELPQAALQVTLGFGLSYQSRAAKDENGRGASFGSVGVASNALSLKQLIASGLQLFLYL